MDSNSSTVKKTTTEYTYTSGTSIDTTPAEHGQTVTKKTITVVNPDGTHSIRTIISAEGHDDNTSSGDSMDDLVRQKEIERKVQDAEIRDIIDNGDN